MEIIALTGKIVEYLSVLNDQSDYENISVHATPCYVIFGDIRIPCEVISKSQFMVSIAKIKQLCKVLDNIDYQPIRIVITESGIEVKSILI